MLLCAAIGALQPPSSSFTNALSHPVVIHDWSHAKSPRRLTSNPFLACTTITPWQFAGIISSGVKYLLILCSSPRRLTPAAASTSAEYSPRSSFSSLVMTFPLTGFMSAPGYSFLSCMLLLALDEPMGFEKSISEAPCGSISTSLGSSLLPVATIGSSEGMSIGMSLKLCTVMSTPPSSIALSSSFTKSPLPPILSSVLSRIMSPVVFIVTSSTSISGLALFMASMTICVCMTASLLSLLPTLIFFKFLPS